MKMIYCPTCGKLLTSKEIGDEGFVPWCDNCQKGVFDIAYPCVILIVENEYKEICVIEQSYGHKKPVLVAGFVKYGSDVETTIKEEVLEEIGHEVLEYKYLYSYFQENRGNLMLGFICHVKKKEFILSKELSSALWATYDEALDLLKNSTIALKLLKVYLGKDND